MSPSSSSVCAEKRDSLQAAAMAPKDLHISNSHAGGTFQLGSIRKQQEGSHGTLKVSRESHRIRKPPLPLPQVQYRPPIIIHTYSPKVIHTEPDDFMSLVQKLTGSSDTKLRLKSKSKSVTKEMSSSSQDIATTVANNLERQGSGNSGSSSATNCGSPSSSEEDSASFLVPSEAAVAAAGNNNNKVKQSNSPRSPFDSSFEFDNVNESLMTFSHFDPSGNSFSQSTVKAEPMFSFTENHHHLNPFNFCHADFMVPPKVAPLPMPSRAHQEMPGVPNHVVVDHHQLIPTTLLASSFNNNLMSGLPDFSPAWSQPNFLDSFNAPGSSSASHFMNQAPNYQRQRFSPGGYGTLNNSPELVGSSTMVALDNIQAFMLT